MANPLPVSQPDPRGQPAAVSVGGYVAPDQSARGPLPLPLLHAPGSPAAASYRALRRRVQRTGHARRIAVTSPGAGEGKSITAANLALAIAEQQNERVLLVESNRLRPILAQALAADVSACFERQLAACVSDPESDWSPVAAGLPQLHLLAVDRATARGSPVPPQAYRRLVQSAEHHGYDYVIFDCPSVEDGSDLSLLCDQVDAILFTARAGRTRRRQLEEALEHVKPAPVLGIVLSGAEP